MLVTTVWVLCLMASTYASKLSPDFAAQLLVNAVHNNADDNIIVSPFALLGPLGALTVGSGYTTRREILEALGLSNKTDVLALYEKYKQQLSKLDGVQLHTANKIYIASGEEINHRYHSQTDERFDLQVENIDFNKTRDASQAITRWVENNTHKKIVWDLPIKPQLKSVLVNAVSLNAQWKDRFVQAKTGIFHTNESWSYTVRYIASGGYVNYNHSEELNADVVSVPLKDPTCQLVIVVPDLPISVESILKALNNDGDVVNKALKHLERRSMMLSIPNLDDDITDTTTDLKTVLRKMGVERAFEENAQIRRTIKNNSELFLDEARQKVILHVDKEGIEGTASNVVEVMPQSFDVNADMAHMEVNSQFYMEVRCSNIILFNGIIRQPKPVLLNDLSPRQCCGTGADHA